jgi:hypothetical protein
LVDNQVHEIEKAIFEAEHLSDLRKRTALEARRLHHIHMPLERISESSVCHDLISLGGSPRVSISENDNLKIRVDQKDGSNRADNDGNQNTQGEASNKRQARKASIDSSTTVLLSKSQQDMPYIDKPLTQAVVHPNADNAQVTNGKKSFTKITKTTLPQFVAHKTQTSANPITSLDPRQVFLQLFNANPLGNDREQVMLIPDAEDILRSIFILDNMSCFMMHKIGVIYIGPGQVISVMPNILGYYSNRQFIIPFFLI